MYQSSWVGLYSIRSDKLDSIGADIPESFVIYRNKDGNPVSRFSDDEWVLRPNEDNGILRFELGDVEDKEGELYQRIIYQIKVIMWFWLFCPEVRRSRLKPNVVGPNRFVYLLAIAKLCYSLKIDLFACGNSAGFTVRLKSSILSHALFRNKQRGRTVRAALNEFQGMLHVEDIRSIGFKGLWAESNAKMFRGVFEQAIKAAKNAKPTKLIPTRILGYFIGRSFELVDSDLAKKIISISQSLLDSKPLSVENYFKNLSNCDSDSWSYIYKFIEDNCNDYHGYEDEKSRSIHYVRETFYGILTDYQNICMLMVHAFTGARRSEVTIAPYNCYSEVDISGFGKAAFFTTRTRKVLQDNYSVPLQWVTTPELLPVIELARAIAIIKMYINGRSIQLDKLPLFPAPGPNSKNKGAHYEVSTAVVRRASELLYWYPKLLIEKEDIKELYEFDFLAFEEGELKEGECWVLTPHQFRRSLAVYAARAGMVSLPSLGAQFKHVSAIMTALYARSSTYAKSFIPLNKNGFPLSEFMVVGEFNNAQIERNAVKIEEEIINYKSKLGGARGSAIQRLKDKDELPVHFQNREATVKALKDKRNPLIYHSTPVGGCFRAKMCGSFGVDIVIPCVFGCADASTHPDKVDRYVAAMEEGYELLDPDSMHAKYMRMTLDKIKITQLDTDEV